MERQRAICNRTSKSVDLHGGFGEFHDGNDGDGSFDRAKVRPRPLTFCSPTRTGSSIFQKYLLRRSLPERVTW